MSIKNTLATSVAAVAFAGMASAATIDFTDNSVYTSKSNFSATGTTAGVTWTVTSIPDGGLTYTDFDGSDAMSPLANDFDGIGVGDDEISNNTTQFVTVTFSQNVTFTGAQFLDLFSDPAVGSEDQEMALVFFGAADGTADAMFQGDQEFPGTGYFSGSFSWTGNVLTFGVADNSNDGVGVGDYALAAISFESAVIPLPAAGFLLLGGLGGLAAMKRRKK